jgi:hypothetical protein
LTLLPLASKVFAPPIDAKTLFRYPHSFPAGYIILNLLTVIFFHFD